MLDHGPALLGDGRVRFAVWAPHHGRVDLVVLDPVEHHHEMEAASRGWHVAEVDGVEPGARYRFRLGGGVERPDPASRHQPEGVHGPSAVVDPAFDWSDGTWRGLRLDDLVLYELHVGTFTPEGTLDAAVDRLDALAEVGVTAVELMPLAQFPGTRNWGYDGVDLYAVQDSYGGPAALRRFVDACHARGLGVVLDVVYNHLGPEGNYLADFGPYFTDAYRTPWGQALNFDGAGSDAVRSFFVGNACMWVDEFHVDGLRLDAVHAIVDASAYPFVEEVTRAVHDRSEGRALVVAEDAYNDTNLTEVAGLDGQWNDDFHHAVHALLTGEGDGYYQDFGDVADLEAVLRHGFAYGHRYSPHRGHRVGRPPGDPPVEPARLVGFVQNHDQVGNRAAGERLDALVDWETRKLAAALVALSPFPPLLFMGEEYGEPAPFQYFVDHSDPGLVEAVREGRRAEFAGFGWGSHEVPDPADPATFERSRLEWERRGEGRHAVLLELYRELLALRREVHRPAAPTDTSRAADVLVLARPGSRTLFNTGTDAAPVPLPAGTWEVRLDTASARWGGPGGEPVAVKSDGRATFERPPRSCVVLVEEAA